MPSTCGKEWNGLNSSGVDWGGVDELVEAGGISLQFWFGFLFLGCLFQSWHFLADGCVVLNFHFHSGPCHTCWADLLSIALETWISADSESCQNPKLVPAFWMWCLELRVFPGRAVVSRKFSSWWFELKLIHLDEMLSKMSTLYMSGKSAPGLQRWKHKWVHD